MPEAVKLLKSKLLIPPLAKTIIRDRLHPIVNDITQKKLTIVAAGPGYGKSTLVARFAALMHGHTVWYNLDRSDMDFRTFLTYMVFGIRQYFPEFGIETCEQMEKTRNGDPDHEFLLTIFLSELEDIVDMQNADDIKPELLIVFDDYHLIQDNAQIGNLLIYLINHLPPTVHIILIGRTVPALPLSRLKSKREIVEISQTELAFTKEETYRFCHEILDIRLKKENLETIHKKTRGWITALILFYPDLSGRIPLEIGNRSTKIDGARKNIFRYFEENVYGPLDGEIKNFLVTSSILSGLNPERCDNLFNTHNAIATLRYLEDSCLFTSCIDEETKTFVFHPLFRDFLETQLKLKQNKNQILKLHHKVALLYEKNAQFGEALAHYLEARQLEEIGRLLGGIGRQLFWEGNRQQIDIYLAKIPERYLDSEPWIQYLHALSLWSGGKPRESVRFFKRALKTFQENGEVAGEVQCMTDMSINFFGTRDYLNAEAKLKEILEKKPMMPYLLVEVLGHLTFTASCRGDLAVAGNYFDEAMSVLPAVDNKTYRQGARAWLYLANSYRYFLAGDFGKAINEAGQAKEIVDGTACERLLAHSYQLIALSMYHMGNFQSGLENAEKGLGIVKEKELTDGSLIRLLVALALNHIGLGKIKEAVELLELALKHARKKANYSEQAYAHMTLFFAFMVSGDLFLAQKHARAGEKIIKGVKLPLLEGEMNIITASLLIEKKQFAKALPLIEGAGKCLLPFKWHRAWVSRVSARYFWKQDRKEDAVEALLPGLALCRDNQYNAWMTFESKWIIPLLLEIYARGKMQDYIRELFIKLGQDGAKALNHLKGSGRTQEGEKVGKAAASILMELPKPLPPPLKVRLLGKFEVSVGEEKIPSRQWKSLKAKMLFKYLIFFRSKGYINKEVLMELLWPEDDAAKTGKRFHVALASMRKTLEPDIQRGIPSSYIVSNSNAYRLVIGENGRIDTDYFKTQLQLAEQQTDPEKSIAHYLAAESVYKGNFLEEDLYIDWCGKERERLKEQYLNLIMILLKYHESKKAYAKCIRYTNKYLNIDRYAESVYQQLMSYYSLSGDKTRVERTFERCKNNIQHDLQCPLNSETVDLYKTLMTKEHPHLVLMAS